MWKLATYLRNEELELEVFIDDKGPWTRYCDGSYDREGVVIRLSEGDCYWKWWSIDCGYFGNSHPYTFGEPSPNFISLWSS